MREILITSSVLILMLLVLRQAFREKISRRVQYALWGLVLVRLLVPVSLPALDLSVLTLTEPVHETISERLEAPAFVGPVGPVQNLPVQPQPENYPVENMPTISDAAPVTVPPGLVPEEKAVAAAGNAKTLTVTEILTAVWLAGVGAMALWLVVSNLSFAAKLRKNRIEMGKLPGTERKVYMVEEGLASPCLFGFLRPAIYLTPSAAASEAGLRHVLAHEETHARHLDPLWALLRGVCLAVYWFDPLVWVAASAAKTDCELACDEGAIRRLGEEERLAYGRTLLSLIPIRRLPGNPLLSATTMSSDKKRLRDRITRIAENRKTRKLALLALVVLMTATCVFTFAGCVEKAKDDPAVDPAPDASPEAETINAVVPREDGPLAAGELWYFNEQFFNSGAGNINNKFLSSIYETPADIDIFELVYCDIPAEYYRDSGKPKADEDTILNKVYDGYWPDCATYSISTATLDALLMDKMGQTLAETKKTGMQGFVYLSEYDTYYWAHGDTNVRLRVDILEGVWEGDLVHLYYNDTFYADGWKCVTLRAVGNGRYQFVSNVYCEKPVIPTVYPAGEPVLTIPLDYSQTSMPFKLEPEDIHSGDFVETIPGYGRNVTVGERLITTYRSTDGNICVAEVLDDGTETGVWEAKAITYGVDNDTFYIESFDDIFGWEGIVGHYSSSVEESYQTYYGVDENGDWYQLIHVPGYGMDCRSIDLDGDGFTELLCTDSALEAKICYRKDGKIYSDDIAALLKEAWPEADFITFQPVQPYARCLSVQAVEPVMSENGQSFQAVVSRGVYFDGKNLLVYKPEKSAVDHFLYGVTGPEDVVSVLRDEVQAELDAYRQGNVEFVIGDAGYDDWRVTSLTGPYYEWFPREDETVTVEIYRFGYEFHAAAPEKVVIAGSMYIDEDGWFCPGYANCDYLYFLRSEDGSRKYLFRMMENDCFPDDELFRADLEDQLISDGFLDLRAGQRVQAVLDRIMDNESVVLELARPADPVGESKGFSVSPSAGNSPDQLGSVSFLEWSAVDGPLDGDPRASADVLTVSASDGSAFLRFYSGSELVRCREGDSEQWFRAKNLMDPEEWSYPYSDIFNYMRGWYDEAEARAACAEVVVPDEDHNMSYEEIAETWANLYEGTSLWLSDGNRYKWNYLEIRDVDVDSWDYIARENYPENIGDHEAFLFSYSAVFVPDGDPYWFIAGNTAEYTGDDAPEGAYQWWRIAYIYRDEDGWRCDGPGTGP